MRSKRSRWLAASLVAAVAIPAVGAAVEWRSVQPLLEASGLDLWRVTATAAVARQPRPAHQLTPQQVAQAPATPAESGTASGAPAPATEADGAKASAADDQTGTGQTAWTLRCNPRCSIFQTISVRRGNATQRVLTVAIQTQAQSDDDVLLLSLPHGLFLPAGVEFQIDDAKADKMEVQTSDANGAYSGTKFTPEMLKAFTGGKTLKVGMVSADRKKLTVPATLAGFGDAYEKFQRLKK